MLSCFCLGDSTPSTMVLPDDVIHGTPRHRFEMHDLSDVAGGKWKAVHIPDEDISSLLTISDKKKGSKDNFDIEHDLPTERIPAEVHGRVHAFDNSSRLKNNSRSLGNLLVGMEDKDRGKEAPQFYGFIRKNKKLPDHPKEEDAKSREIHSKTISRPSLIVARIPDGDDGSEDNLPLQKLPDPIVATLRKTSPKIRPGASRSVILDQLKTQSSSTRSKTISPLGDGTSSHDASGVVVSYTSEPQAVNSKATNENEAPQESKDPKSLKVLHKIKNLLLKSHSVSEDGPITVKTARKSEQKSLSEVSAPVKETSPLRNNDGLFLPSSNSQTNAFSNHAAVLNKISSSKKEALLVGIIKALLSRDKMKMSANGMNINSLPHYNRQAVLQGIQSLHMRKTFANAQNNGASPAVDTGDPESVRNLDELYQKQRDLQVKQELGKLFWDG